MPKCDFNKVANFIEISLRHGCSPVNLLRIFRTPFPRGTSEWLLLNIPDIQIFSGLNRHYLQLLYLSPLM